MLLFNLPHSIILAAWAALPRPCLSCQTLLRYSHVAAEDQSVLWDMHISGPCISLWKGLGEVPWHDLYNCSKQLIIMASQFRIYWLTSCFVQILMLKKKKKWEKKKEKKKLAQRTASFPPAGYFVDPGLREGAARLWVTRNKTVRRARGNVGEKANDRIRCDVSFTYLLVRKSYPKYYQLDLSYKYAHSLTVSS